MVGELVLDNVLVTVGDGEWVRETVLELRATFRNQDSLMRDRVTEHSGEAMGLPRSVTSFDCSANTK